MSWSGTSTADLAQGALLFSNLLWLGGGGPAYFEVAQRVSAVPEPSTTAGVAAVLAGLALSQRRLRRADAAILRLFENRHAR